MPRCRFDLATPLLSWSRLDTASPPTRLGLDLRTPPVVSPRPRLASLRHRFGLASGSLRSRLPSASPRLALASPQSHVYFTSSSPCFGRASPRPHLTCPRNDSPRIGLGLSEAWPGLAWTVLPSPSESGSPRRNSTSPRPRFSLASASTRPRLVLATTSHRPPFSSARPGLASSSPLSGFGPTSFSLRPQPWPPLASPRLATPLSGLGLA